MYLLQKSAEFRTKNTDCPVTIPIVAPALLQMDAHSMLSLLNFSFVYVIIQFFNSFKVFISHFDKMVIAQASTAISCVAARNIKNVKITVMK